MTRDCIAKILSTCCFCVCRGDDQVTEIVRTAVAPENPHVIYEPPKREPLPVCRCCHQLDFDTSMCPATKLDLPHLCRCRVPLRDMGRFSSLSSSAVLRTRCLAVIHECTCDIRGLQVRCLPHTRAQEETPGSPLFQRSDSLCAICLTSLSVKPSLGSSQAEKTSDFDGIAEVTPAPLSTSVKGAIQLVQCSHLFHSECLKSWYMTCGPSKTCPICRKVYPVPPS